MEDFTWRFYPSCIILPCQILHWAYDDDDDCKCAKKIKKYKNAPGKRSKKEENGGKGPWETRQTVSKAPRASLVLNLTGSRETALSLSSACLAACLYPMTLWAGLPSVQGLEMIHALSGALVHG